MGGKGREKKGKGEGVGSKWRGEGYVMVLGGSMPLLETFRS